MVTSKVILLQRAVSLATNDATLRDRWTPVALFERALKVCYEFQYITPTTSFIPKAYVD